MGLSWPVMSEGKWNLIAENTVSGNATRLKANYKCWGTEVDTGEDAPPDTIAYRDKNPVLFEKSNIEPIESKVAIDCYVWIENSDTETDDIDVENIIRVNI